MNAHGVAAGWTVALALVSASVVLAVLNAPTPVPVAFFALRGSVPPVFGLLGLLNCALGGFVVTRRPGNRLGWLLFAAGLMADLWAFAFEYALFGLRTAPGTVPATAVAAELAASLLVPVAWILGLLPPLLFPDGRLPSPAWLLPLLVALAGALITAVATVLLPGPYLLMPFAENAFAVAVAPDVVVTAITVGSALGLAALAFGLAGVVVRYRRAAGDEQQQLKWFISAAVVVAASQGMGAVPTIRASEAFMNLTGAAAALMPIAMTVAILRYRLYAIDILIRRTIIYAATTLALGAVFFASVLIVLALLRPFTGGSELAVASSTLATVALFQPLRTRIQSAVDRRFYRSRYDAARIISGFTDELSYEVDLNAVRAGLIDAVAQAVQPAHASLWLRERGL